MDGDRQRTGQDQNPRGKVIDYRIPLQIDRVTIHPGDILFGDMDGICVIPQRDEEEIFSLAHERARGEKAIKNSLISGMSAKKTFANYEIM